MAEMTPAAWLDLLEKRLDDRWARMRVLDDYFCGRRRLAFATEKFRQAFGSLFWRFADNWCPIIVESATERLRVQGFRFGDSQEADADAWAIWQENGLDAESNLTHTEAVKLGEAYWLVAPPERAGGVPMITAEHPSQMIVATAPGNRKRRLAALKRWVDDDGYAYATLYLPDQLVKWRSQRKVKGGARIDWERRRDDPGGRNPLGEVPVVPLRNNPSMLSGGRSDLEPAVPLFDSIDKLAVDLLVASEYAAFRQRVLTGVEVPKDPNTGMPLPGIDVKFSLTKLFTVEAPDAKVFDMPASDLKNYVNAIEMFIQHLAAQTRTPPHYLIGTMVNVSGDALKAAETGLTSKCREKTVTFGEGHEDMMRLALKAAGQPEKAEITNSETIWADVESRSFGELVDGLVKLGTIGYPKKVLWEKAGASPQEIARMEAMQTVEDLVASLNQPTPEPAPNGNGRVPTDAGV